MPEQQTKKEQILLSWQTQEFRHYPKNLAWYITLAVVAALIIGFMVVQRDIFGAVCILIFTIFIVIFSRQEPRTLTVTLTTNGLYLDESYIPYKSIKHFWIVYNDNHKTINMETAAYLNRTLIIQLGDQDPDTVRDILAQVVPEHEDTEETLAQRIMHHLKF